MDNNQIPPAPPSPDSPPIPFVFTADQCNYLIHKVDFYRTEMQKLVDVVLNGGQGPGDLIIIMAFLLSVMETQIPVLREDFEEIRTFWNQIYPAMIQLDIEQHPDDVIDVANNFMLVWPKLGKHAAGSERVN